MDHTGARRKVEDHGYSCCQSHQQPNGALRHTSEQHVQLYPWYMQTGPGVSRSDYISCSWSLGSPGWCLPQGKLHSHTCAWLHLDIGSAWGTEASPCPSSCHPLSAMRALMRLLKARPAPQDDGCPATHMNTCFCVRPGAHHRCTCTSEALLILQVLSRHCVGTHSHAQDSREVQAQCLPSPTLIPLKNSPGQELQQAWPVCLLYPLLRLGLHGLGLGIYCATFSRL